MNWYYKKDGISGPHDDDAIFTAGLNVVLVNPEIAPNAGNISRLCFATGTKLHIVGKMGFSVADRHFKRAAVDYWDRLDIAFYPDLAELQRKVGAPGGPPGRLIYTSTNGKFLFYDFEYEKGDYIVFGPESTGLSREVVDSNHEMTVRIPLNSKVRSLNLSTACGIVLFHAIYALGRK